MLGCEGHNLTWFADPVNHLEPLETFLLRLHLDKGPRTTKQPPGFIERQKKQLYISTEVHARAQPETDEDGAHLPLDDTQVGGGGVGGWGGGGGGGGEKQGRRHKRLELHRVWGIVRMCLWGYNVHIAHSSCRKLMTIQLFNVSYWSACMITI